MELFINIFFDSWDSIGRTLATTALAYVAMILLLRMSGKRTLSKMNAFDFIVTVALGSVLAAVALNANISLLDGIVAFGFLIFLQFTITWLSVRIKTVKKLVSSEPTMLLYRGERLSDEMKKQRITIEEIYVAARQKGITDLKQIDVIVLESTGEITIIEQMGKTGLSTLSDVQNFGQ